MNVFYLHLKNGDLTFHVYVYTGKIIYLNHLFIPISSLERLLYKSTTIGSQCD